MKISSNKTLSGLFNNRIFARSGKTDVTIAEFQITTELDEKLMEIIKLFNHNYNFSVKNYLRFGSLDRDISLGESNFIKSIIATLSIIDSNSTSIINTITSVIEQYKSIEKNKNNILIHLNHLRFLYELTGGV